MRLTSQSLSINLRFNEYDIGTGLREPESPSGHSSPRKMEWHLFLTIAASFFAILGFLMDLQSLLGGIQRLRKGRAPRPLYLWPIAAYLVAALIYDGALPFRAEAFGVGVIFHLVATMGLRPFGGRWKKPDSS